MQTLSCMETAELEAQREGCKTGRELVMRNTGTCASPPAPICSYLPHLLARKLCPAEQTQEASIAAQPLRIPFCFFNTIKCLHTVWTLETLTKLAGTRAAAQAFNSFKWHHFFSQLHTDRSLPNAGTARRAGRGIPLQELHRRDSVVNERLQPKHFYFHPFCLQLLPAPTLQQAFCCAGRCFSSHL